VNKNQLIEQIQIKKTFLCIGLDVDLDKIPNYLFDYEDPIFEFNKAIIDATHDLAVAYKPNTAFYEAYGLKGWQSLEKTIGYLNDKHPEIFTIADAKRGDIGNTSTRYAKAFFEQLNFDALTVAPYMGQDSIEPFLEFKNKFTILLALTSNTGSADFQMLKTGHHQPVFERILKKSLTYKNSENLMFVVGATQSEYLKKVREIVPYHFLLIPGVGAQGGDLESVCVNGMNENIGLLINSSREIIYAGNGLDFAEKAKMKALEMALKMREIMDLNAIK